ncbi:hypothetical protein E308F_10080 [Moorella sp. E308F]|uniref:hypothetical protein n=1 Tax=unclassified Neomoorella TaxID=2676739 RepID=UPI0010FFB470|nr:MULTISPECIES: hypothetical protein [unclassified Moorella (in: firmicutes)]GEA14766.1 hypothetical protein E308F_10080 [Moorella sp. E308F]GEA17866.1 hypothetical protein E306M_10000 [Moorella sp. E306M]
MSKRTAGISLLAIAAFLHGIHYLAAAIFASGVSSWSKDLFRSMLGYTAPGLAGWAKIALAVGIIYLFWAEVEAWRQKK